MTRLVILLAIGLTGCATKHPVPAVSDPGRTSEESWALVLDRYVDNDGLVDFKALATDRAPLDHVVASIAEPRRDPTVAFCVNSYNALAMHNVFEAGVPPKDGLGFFILQSYNVGGRYLNLYDFEHKLIIPKDEPRVHFVLNCMSWSCPPLPREPLRDDTLEEQLEAAATAFFNDDRHVQVSDERREVYLSRVMDWYRKEFLKQAPTLISYVNRYRQDAVPEDYNIKYLRWDWSLIGVPP